MTAATKADGVGGESGHAPGLPASFAGQPLTTQDVRMLKRAVDQGWELPENVRQVLPSLAFAMARGLRVDPLTQAKLKMSETGQIRAIEMLMRMVDQNRDIDPGPARDGDGDQELDLSHLSVEELRELDRMLHEEAGNRTQR